MALKSKEFYELKRDMFTFNEVNFEAFIENLNADRDEFQGEKFIKSHKLSRQ